MTTKSTLKLTRGCYAGPGTTIGYKTGSWRIQRPEHNHRPAPCHAACPAGEDPQAYLALLDEGKPREAWESLVSVNPMPAITGRVCPHPCESGCNRGEYDDPLAIHSIERFLGDEAIAKNWAYPVTDVPTDAARVAVIGAGPAGLSAAYHLHRQGLQVTVFDEHSEAGGTLFTIPDYRLPSDIVRKEITRLLDTGIDFKASHKLGRDHDLEDLQQEYSAIFLAPGVMKSSDWNVDGVTPRDLHQGLHLLKQWSDVGSLPEMKSAAVIGGGNTAIDIARLLRRNGVDTHIVIHSNLPDPAHPTAEDMRAIPREIEQALEEGVQIHDHHGVKRLILRGEKLTGIEIVRMRKLPDEQGRLHRVAFEGTESILHVDQVIPAIGQVIDAEGMQSLLDGSRHFKVNEYGLLNDKQPTLYAGGDAIEGNGGTVTEAVGNGRVAALAMAATLREQTLPTLDKSEAIAFKNLNMEYFEPANRAEQAILPVAERIDEAEIERGLSSQQAEHEASRCFACGNCLRCDNCWTLCPDSAVLKTDETLDDGSHYVFDYDFCKGCGLCAVECPTGYISIVGE
ncbi:MAG TPA: FAD-dependent oxidoreductase [Gammaproteobacteria bacterium]|nr:FAD-dependent oxidoreductase [Gammaproteobacteria bacterium]